MVLMRITWYNKVGKETHIYWVSALCHTQTRWFYMIVKKPNIRHIFPPQITRDAEGFALHSGPYTVSYSMGCFLRYFICEKQSTIWERHTRPKWVNGCCLGCTEAIWQNRGNRRHEHWLRKQHSRVGHLHSRLLIINPHLRGVSWRSP